MGASTDTTEIAAEADGSFAIDMARSDSLKKAAALFGTDAVRLIWRMGWCSGKSAGLDHARRIITE